MSLSKHDYEEYRTNVEKLVYKYLSKDRSTAASVITHAVDSGADKRKLADKLSSHIDKSLALKLAEKSFQLLDQLGLKLKTRKRGLKADEEEQNVPPSAKESKRAKTEASDMGVVVASPPSFTSAPAALHQKQIQDIMAKAQADIEARKKALSGVIKSSQPATAPENGAAAALPTGAAVNSRIAELQARIRSQISSVPALGVTTPSPPGIIPSPAGIIRSPAGIFPSPAGIIPPPQLLGGLTTPIVPLVTGSATGLVTPKPIERPPPIILNSEGRTLDLTGKEIHIASRVPTLKANIRAKKREEFKMQLAEKPGTDELPDNNFYDNRVSVRPANRPKKMAFKFHDKGKFVQLAQRERAKARLEKLQTEIKTAAKRTGISSAARLAQVHGEEIKNEMVETVVPDIEWWDSLILQNDSYPDPTRPIKVKDDYITNLIEHPLEMRCPNDTSAAGDLKVFLTAKERKKLRRMNRREAWKEKQDKIRLGLEPPPEPKVRMANLMRVLGTEAVLDPTKMEKHVRDQMAKRLKAHEEANAKRKLTPQQRKEKKIAKLKEDTTAGVHVAVYRVTDLSNGSHKFKVETNARQLFMTGVAVLCRDASVVVVEGGPRQQKKYRQLMLHRIKWVEEARTNTQSGVEPKCQLVWEGTVLERNFGEMQFKSCPSESFARDLFKRHGVEHYWDMAYGRKIYEETESL